MVYHLPQWVTLLLCGISCFQASIFDNALEWAVDNVKRVEKPIVDNVEKVAKPFARDIANLVPHTRAARSVYEQEMEFEPGTDEKHLQIELKKCLNGEILWKRRCYYFSKDRVSWFDAITTCGYGKLGNKGMLLEIYTQSELEFVAKRIKHLGQKGEYWLGASSFLNHTEYRWRHNQRIIDTKFWAAHEPSNTGGWERCVEITSAGMTNDDACSAKQFFVCDRSLCDNCGEKTIEDDYDELV